jgi:hypothetical protein
MAAALSSFGSAVTAVAVPVLVVQLLGAPLDTPQFSARCRKGSREYMYRKYSVSQYCDSRF